MDNQEMLNRFSYHAPRPDQIQVYKDIRDAQLVFAAVVDQLVPESREKALAMTNIEQAGFWANAGVARRS